MDEDKPAVDGPAGLSGNEDPSSVSVSASWLYRCSFSDSLKAFCSEGISFSEAAVTLQLLRLSSGSAESIRTDGEDFVDSAAVSPIL